MEAAVTTELYIGEYVRLPYNEGSLGIIMMIGETTVIVARILSQEVVTIDKESAKALRLDLKRNIIGELVALRDKLPKGYTMQIKISDPNGNIIASEGYIGGTPDRISNN